MGHYGERLPNNTNNNETTDNIEIILVKSEQHFNDILANIPVDASDVQHEAIGYVPIKFDNLGENYLPAFDISTESLLTTEVVKSSVEIARSSTKVRDPATRKSNIMKQRCQEGKEYADSSNQIKPKKSVRNKKDCFNKCRNICAKKVKQSDRVDQFEKFDKMNREEQQRFLLETSERKSTKRSKETRKNYNFFYYMKVADVRIKVCKQFYLGTFGISQKKIYNAHKKNQIQIVFPADVDH